MIIIDKVKLEDLHDNTMKQMSCLIRTLQKNQNVIKMFGNVVVMYRNVCYACYKIAVWRC